MRIQELIKYIKSLVPFSLYPNAFPTTSEDECGVVTISAGIGIDSDTGVKRPGFQILIRGKAKDSAKTEERAYEIFEALANKKEQQIGGLSVVIIRPNGSAPFYIGMDERERPLYSMNFTTVIRP